MNRVRLSGVGMSFDSVDDGPGARVLDSVDLEVGERESVAIVGASGSGKSTLLNIIGTLLRPTSGDVEVVGRSISGMNEDELARLRSEKIGFVFQAHHLLPQCSALENVLVPTLVGSGDRTALEERARALLERVGLAERINHRPGQLSGGECQRVAVVRALIQSPELVLADEPTGSLDAESADEVATLLVEMQREEGVALIVVTHSSELAAKMDRTVKLEKRALATR